MHLVIDNKIPFIEGQAERLGTCTYLPGAAITAEDVRDADVLIVRTRTHCTRALLEGSRVQLVVTATIGHDHIDKAYLSAAGIAWANCPGCNATSVGQYVRNALRLASAAGHLDPRFALDTLPHPLTVGIVGCGHVGTAVIRALEAEGCRTLHCDPPKGEPATLADLARECQVITLHTPLTTGGEYATFHLANAEFFASLHQCRVFINAARGECTDTQALKAAIRSGKVACAVIDTWENEPDIDRELLDLAFIATPHIAGYSADGKANGTRMSLQHIIDHFRPTPCPQLSVQAPNLPSNFDYAQEVISQLPASFSTSYPWLSPEITAILPHSASSQLQQYDALADTFRLRSAPNSFEFQRGHYPLRRE